MDVRLSAEQQALRDAAAQLAGRLGPHAVGQLDDPERHEKLDAAVAGAGWRELRTPMPSGQPWASAVEVAIIAEALGRALVDTPFLGPTLAADLRRLAGAPPASSRESVGLEPGLGALAQVRDGRLADGAVAVDSAHSDSVLVLVPVPHGHRLGAVSAGVPPASPVDLTRPSRLLAASLAVEPLGGDEAVLSPDDLLRWTALGLACVSADLVGVMRGAVGLACDYAAARRQYGVAIGSFQAVQHLLADAHVAVEGSWSAGLHAAWAVDALPAAEALAAAAVAKAYCARAARQVCEAAIQVHGGIGNTWDCLAHVFLRRALLSIDVLGGEGPNVARVLDHHGIGGDHGLR
jgi:alkylation response protein AidB-like acyl-CoA dehydrogenase